MRVIFNARRDIGCFRHAHLHIAAGEPEIGREVLGYLARDLSQVDRVLVLRAYDADLQDALPQMRVAAADEQALGTVGQVIDGEDRFAVGWHERLIGPGHAPRRAQNERADAGEEGRLYGNCWFHVLPLPDARAA